MARFPAVDVVVGVKNDGQDLHGSSTTNCVTLHSSWIGSSLEEPVFLGHGAHPSLRPVSSDLNSMATFFEFPDYCFFKTGFQNQFSWIGFTGEEGFRKMFGMETGSIYCLLKIHVPNKVAQQKYRLPLVLLVAAGRTLRIYELGKRKLLLEELGNVNTRIKKEVSMIENTCAIELPRVKVAVKPLQEAYVEARQEILFERDLLQDAKRAAEVKDQEKARKRREAEG